jgi:hypothetical protein
MQESRSRLTCPILVALIVDNYILLIISYRMYSLGDLLNSSSRLSIELVSRGHRPRYSSPFAILSPSHTGHLLWRIMSITPSAQPVEQISFW